MNTATRDAEFTEYATAYAGRLRQTAFLMCGDWHRAQDLTQLALAKAYVAWPRIRDRDAIDAYVRRIIVHEYLGQQRRRSWHERPSAELPEPVGDAPADPAELADLRLTLLEALARLTPKRRAVVVLRYWEDHSVETVASILRMTTSSVKSASVRALADLRAELGHDLHV